MHGRAFSDTQVGCKHGMLDQVGSVWVINPASRGKVVAGMVGRALDLHKVTQAPAPDDRLFTCCCDPFRGVLLRFRARQKSVVA